jgi:hypothetical protein
MLDGVVQKADPEGIIAYVAVPFVKWREDMGYA